MSDEGIPARLSKLTAQWEWVSEAPSRVDALTSTFSALNTRLEDIDYDGVNSNITTLMESSEKEFPQLADKLSESQQALDSRSSSFDTTISELSQRLDTIQSQVG